MASESLRPKRLRSGPFSRRAWLDKRFHRVKRPLALHLERLEDRHMMDGAGFVNTDPPEDPDSIIGVAGIVALDDHRETRRGTLQLRLDPLGNDQLPDGSESLKIKSVSATKLGNKVTISDDGRRLLYRAGDGGLRADDTFYYIVESNDGKLGKANVNLTLSSSSYYRGGGGGGYSHRNAKWDNYEVFEDSREQQLHVLRNDRDFQNGEIVAVAMNSNHYYGPLNESPARGAMRIAEDGKSLFYQPATGFNGLESFVYTVRNESGEESTASVRVEVKKPITVPLRNSSFFQYDFGTGSKTSPELFHQRAATPQKPFIESIDAPDHVGNFSLTAQETKLHYKPASNFIGSFKLSYTVRYGAADYQYVTNTLHYKIDNTFLAVDNWYSVEPESEEVQLPVLENDPTFRYWKRNGTYKERFELKVVNTSTGSHGGQLRIAPDGKSVFYQSAEGFSGDEVFSYEVQGSNGARDRASVTVHVADKVVDASGVDRFVNEAELQQFLLDKAVAHHGRQFGVTTERYAPGTGHVYSPYYYELTTAAFDSDGLSQTTNGEIDHSETNTQVTGIDEADIVETDGQYIYTFTNGRLVIVDVSDPTMPMPVSFTSFEGRFDLMYLQGDRMTLLKSGHLHGGSAEVLVIDISDRSAPAVLERTEIDGYIADSRAMGDRVQLVVKSSFPTPEIEGKWLVEPVPPGATTEESIEIQNADGDDWIFSHNLYNSIDRGKAGVWRNETLDEYFDRVRDSLIETGLPSFRSFDANDELINSGLLTDAISIHKPVAGSDQLVSLLTIVAGDDAVGPLAAATSFVADKHTDVYVSAESAYVFAYNVEAGNSTIHKLDFKENGTAPIVASGTIAGRLLNQFSADEHNGYLRVATTEVQSEFIETSWGRRQVQRQLFNNVMVLEQQGNQLVMIGEVTHLAPTETIHSVRFMGDRAFVVTFRRVDPLFALDMSDPTSPSVEGALKIPGFSNYLHPVGSDYLVGFGREADEITGRRGPLQVTLFDVSDLSDPRVADQLTFEGAYRVSSEAWIEHHAVSFFAESGIFAIPISWSEQIEVDPEAKDYFSRYRTENHSAIWTIKVDTSNADGASLTATGSVEHEAASYNRIHAVPIATTIVWIGGWNRSYDPGSPAKRALRVGESLITVSNEYIKINDLNNPKIQLGEVYLGPLTQGDSFEIDEDSGTQVLDVRSNDLTNPNGKLSPLVSFSQPTQGGTVGLIKDGDALSFTPDQDFTGRVSFTYTVLDPARGEETVTVQITVNNVPDEPTAVDDTYHIEENSGSLILNVRENDINPDANVAFPIPVTSVVCGNFNEMFVSSTIRISPEITNNLRITEFSEPSHGVVKSNHRGQWTYTPDADFIGIDTFTYTISTTSGLTDVGTVIIHVGDTSSLTGLTTQRDPFESRESLIVKGEKTFDATDLIPASSIATTNRPVEDQSAADIALEEFTDDEHESLRFTLDDELTLSFVSLTSGWR